MYIFRVAKVSPPPWHLVEAALTKTGFVVRRTHLDMQRGMRTNAPVAACVEAVLQANAQAEVARAEKAYKEAASQEGHTPPPL